MKAVFLLVARTLILLAALPTGVLLITLIFHPDQDGALGLLPILIIAIIGFVILGTLINARWLQMRQPGPPWLRRWQARVVIRLAVVIAFIAILLVANPTF